MDPKALRAMLMANRGKLPAARSKQDPELPAPVAAAGDEAARKRGAEDTDGPSSKRTRTASEPEAAASALLEELAAEQGYEQAPTDEEALPGVRPSIQVCSMWQEVAPCPCCNQGIRVPILSSIFQVKSDLLLSHRRALAA